MYIYKIWMCNFIISLRILLNQTPKLFPIFQTISVCFCRRASKKSMLKRWKKEMWRQRIRDQKQYWKTINQSRTHNTTHIETSGGTRQHLGIVASLVHHKLECSKASNGYAVAAGDVWEHFALPFLRILFHDLPEPLHRHVFSLIAFVRRVLFQFADIKLFQCSSIGRGMR